MSSPKLAGTIRVVGAGLLGTSIGLALTKRNFDVVISSRSSKSVDLAVDYGAGRTAKESDQPVLIVVCVPPEQTAEIVARELIQFPQAFVTDVASIKSSILSELISLAAPIERYVGSHPMAGRERGGALSGRADLFVGRPWVICAHETSDSKAVALVMALASELESSVLELSPENHDRAAALVSHAPQLVASLLAGRLVSADEKDIALAGQGLRDTTRIASSDPNLWMQILSANASEISQVLRKFSLDLAKVIEALESIDESESFQIIKTILEHGNLGVEKIPGKHGTKHSAYAQIIVMVDDKPGELARLLTNVGEIGINLEELKLEHSPSAQIGLVELYVLPDSEQHLIAGLVSLNW